jgi:hypothetical protein
MGITVNRVRGVRAWRRGLLVALAGSLLAAGGGGTGGGGGGTPTLNWYIFHEPSGSFQAAPAPGPPLRSWRSWPPTPARATRRAEPTRSSPGSTRPAGPARASGSNCGSTPGKLHLFNPADGAHLTR